MSDYQLYEGSQDDAVLYVDGVVELYGDRDEVIAHALYLCGIRRILSDSFKLANNEIAATVEAIQEYQAGRDFVSLDAGQMRVEAARLLAEAEALESQGKD